MPARERFTADDPTPQGAGVYAKPAAAKASKAAPRKTAAAAAPPSQAPAPAVDDGSRWEDRTGRHVVFIPHEVFALVQAEMTRTGRSKSRTVTDALREHFTR